MTYGQNPPATDKTAFECPRCGAYTSQTWWKVIADGLGTGKHPRFPTSTDKRRLAENKELDAEEKKRLSRWVDQVEGGGAFLYKERGIWSDWTLENVNVSRCYVCSKPSIWVHKSLVWPGLKTGPAANSDMPDQIARIFEEARDIFGKSARGAAALLRLCVQELCDHLGHKGKKIDTAIADMVKDGLSPVVQQALDSVRVIGNEAVHPGTIDLNDTPETAAKLFGLVNIIVDRMISHPKEVEAIYQALPAEKRAAIERRDTKAKSATQTT